MPSIGGVRMCYAATQIDLKSLDQRRVPYVLFMPIIKTIAQALAFTRVLM